MRPMTPNRWTRRTFLRTVAHTSALLPITPALATTLEFAQPANPDSIERSLSAFITSYMQAMHAPGLTLALVPANGHPTSATFGFSNVELRQPVSPDQLFQIGSISKSFCALALLQMHDEGKLDLQAPILDHLPWLRLDMPYGSITAHHLLTHTAGIPGDDPLFSPDQSARIGQTYAPGKRFWYSSLGFEILGHLAATIDSTTYATCLQRRILNPLAMIHTQPVISDANRSAESQSYVDFRDLAGPRAARLAPAPRMGFAEAGGCVSSTPADMALYIQMLLANGAGPHGRIVSEASFRLFTTPYVDASEDFGPGFDYGYGMAIDTHNGARLLKHTGGMNSFASSLQVDLNARVGAFASINAMQGYRPNPVTTYALAVLRAEATKAPLPSPEPLDDPSQIANATDYAASYTGASGTIVVLAEGKFLRLKLPTATITLERAAGDLFLATDEAWQTYPWRFERQKSATGNGTVTELFYGPHRYATAADRGPKSTPDPKELQPFPGQYGYGPGYVLYTVQVYIAQGVLHLGDTALEQIGEAVFRPITPPDSPERIHFRSIANGKAQLLLNYG